MERARARLVFLARADKTRRARLGSSRQFELNPMSRLISSRQFEVVYLVSFYEPKTRPKFTQNLARLARSIELHTG